METSLLNRKTFFAVLILFVFVFAIQTAEPASAAKWKKFDKGQKTVYLNSIPFTYNWISYKKGTKYAKVYSSWINLYTGEKFKFNANFKKMTKKVIRVKTYRSGKTTTYYFKTKLSAYKFAKWWIRN